MSDDQNPTGKGTMAGSLDLGDRRDVALLNQALKDRPRRFRKMTEAFRDKLTDALEVALDGATEAVKFGGEEALDACDLTGRLVMVGVRMEQANQKDDHHAVDAARGKGENRTENKIVVIQAPSARTMGELRKLAEKGQEGGT